MLMKKNLIFRLFLSVILINLFHSCIHDETLASSDPSSKEYTNKSLWKEDETYIKNVMKIYEQNEDEIKKINGNPLWDFAMTMGHTDESFLIVPIAEGNTIVSCMQVPRNRDSIRFIYDKDQSHISFFQVYTTAKKIKPVEEINISPANKGKLVMCSYSAVSVFIPDSEDNPNGPGHWEVVQYIAICSENPGEGSSCSGYYDSYGNCVPQGYTPPTYPYTPGGVGNGTNTTQDPCKKAESSMTSANTILKNSEVKQKMDVALKGKVQASNEWSVAIGQKPNGQYEVTPPVEQSASNGTIPTSQLTSPYIGDGHSHAGNRGNPSGGDLYHMITSLADNPALKYRFVYGNSDEGTAETYALVINNASLAQQFLSQYPKDENYDPENHSIKVKSRLGVEFYKANIYYQSGAADNISGENYDSRAVAMAYILDKFSAGISVAKADANGNLKKINADVAQITIPYSGGKVKEGIKVSKCP